jgi:hypothetical protein
MSANSELSQERLGPGLDLVPSDPAPAEIDYWAEGPMSPLTRGQRRVYEVFQFGLQGIFVAAIACLLTLPLAFIPSLSNIAWPVFQTLLVTEAAAHVVVVGCMVCMVVAQARATADGA